MRNYKRVVTGIHFPVMGVGRLFCTFSLMYASNRLSNERGNFVFNKAALLNPGFARILKVVESPEILLWYFPGLESPGKRILVQESSGNLLNSSEKYGIYGRQ